MIRLRRDATLRNTITTSIEVLQQYGEMWYTLQLLITFLPGVCILYLVGDESERSQEERVHRNGGQEGQVRRQCSGRNGKRHPPTATTVYRIYFVVYPSNCHVIIILCDVRGGVHWRGTRAATPTADTHCLSYGQYGRDHDYN